MKKIIFRFFIFTILLIFGFITYLSTFGIKTDAFNEQISKEVKKIDNQLEQLIKGEVLNPVITSKDPTIEDPTVFALEKHLEDFLVANWT